MLIASRSALTVVNAFAARNGIMLQPTPAAIQGRARLPHRSCGRIYRQVKVIASFTCNGRTARCASAGVPGKVFGEVFRADALDTETGEVITEASLEGLFLSSDEAVGKDGDEIGTDAEFMVEEGRRVVYVEPWQMKKMVAAASLGASCVNVEALAAEVGLDGSDVLAWLENSSSKAIILDTGEGSYMEDVHIVEEAEKPAVYVPAPPIPSREVNMRHQVEDVMYTLKHIILGSLADVLAHEKRWNTAVKLFSETVEVQNPLFCSRGRDWLFEWVQVLGRCGVVVKLLDIYYENKANDPYKRWVYASWTATLTDDLRKSVVELGLADWWARCQGGDLVNSSSNDDEQHGLGTQSWRKRVLQLSGEWRFEMDESGQVTNVHARWYKMAEQGGGEDFAVAKLWLSGVVRRGLS